MSVCVQARCGTHTRPRSGWWWLNHQIHTSMRSSGVRSLWVGSAWSCRTQMLVAPCGRRVTVKRLSGWMPWKCPWRASTRACEGVP